MRRTFAPPYYPDTAQPSPRVASSHPRINPEDYYLLGGRVGAREAVALAFERAFVYRGRASRFAFWWYALLLAAVGYGLDYYVEHIARSANSVEVTYFIGVVPAAIVAVSLLVPAAALTVRRLHDIDRSGWWALIVLVPVVGPLALLGFSLLPGTRGLNRFS